MSDTRTEARVKVEALVQKWFDKGLKASWCCDLVDDFTDLLLNEAAQRKSETVQTVTTWANTTFGQATIRTQIERAKKEFDELLDLLVVSGELPISAGLPIDKKLAEEAADVCICLYRVIGTLDPEAINKKMAKNRARKWQVDGNGTAQHVGEE